ncbi:phosphoglucomutase (alpha-D-glucose-1,6-bisphosphate-dependent) [Polaromonas glacialis]|uniref:phosphoglucomutase (alpha-D-glucose-1,6-bisphosphate-dependent) n=1 Tax=Polaromonas glacialis TaxID=866564 RepID=UPI0004960DE8|nr:phosphoglucomutase (alpha-D-glucose-1,6-bisphosphate-dependent) [Polaromonas glacialis]
MSQIISPLAGKPLPAAKLVDIQGLLAAYADLQPDPAVPSQRVAFGTSGHRGTSFDGSFNAGHVLAITQALCEHRKDNGIDGPLFIGVDTHALSKPAFDNTLEVLAAHGVQTMVARGGEFTPTPAVSHAILVYNRGRSSGLADGIVITPSHNPPDSGGFKYNPPHGGPADADITGWVQERANALLEGGLKEVKRMALAQARKAATTHEHDFLGAYVADLGNVIDFDVIRSAGLRLGVDPLGGAGVHYWAQIAERYQLDLTVVNTEVDPQFAFMTADWDGKIRMDPSSRYAMQSLIGLKDHYDIAFACDTDHDRHGIVTPSSGLLAPNHYLSVAIDYLFQHRPQWSATAAVGKTVVSSTMIDRVASRLGRTLFEAPVGFKWFAAGLFDGSLGLGGEESAGASFLRRDGRVWTTDKDGIAAALLSAEITARSGRDPGARYSELCTEFGEFFADRIDAPANTAQKQALGRLTPKQIVQTELAGEPITSVIDQAPGNHAAIGGIKVSAKSGWFAARPSGTEDIYKIYAESFQGDAHLRRLLAEAQRIVDAAIEPKESS